jgi:hypothetical protein
MREEKSNMTKQQLLKPVNAILACDFLCLACTAMLDDVLPREVFRRVHPMFGLILIACVASHVFLNWAWIKNTMLKRAKSAA